jgi:hypothetical protein
MAPAGGARRLLRQRGDFQLTPSADMTIELGSTTACNWNEKC